MATKTLAQLRTDSRERADMENSQFVSDSTLTKFINSSAKELYDLLVASNQDYQTLLTTFSVTSTGTYTLPAAFYKLRGIDVQLDGDWVSLRPFNFEERTRFSSVRRSLYQPRVRYRIVNGVVYFFPVEQAAGSYRLWYVPEMTDLVDDDDTTEVFNGWDEFIVVDAARKMKDKEESDTASLERDKKDLVRRITAMANTQDYGAVDTIATVESNYEGIFDD